MSNSTRDMSWWVLDSNGALYEHVETGKGSKKKGSLELLDLLYELLFVEHQPFAFAYEAPEGLGPKALEFPTIAVTRDPDALALMQKNAWWRTKDVGGVIREHWSKLPVLPVEASPQERGSSMIVLADYDSFTVSGSGKRPVTEYFLASSRTMKYAEVGRQKVLVLRTIHRTIRSRVSDDETGVGEERLEHLVAALVEAEKTLPMDGPVGITPSRIFRIWAKKRRKQGLTPDRWRS